MGTNPEALLQLARILGRDELFARLGIQGTGVPPELSEAQLSAGRSLAGERVDDLVRALLEEAAACDDVINAASGLAYLEDRLDFLGELLTEETRSQVRQGYGAVARGWG